MFISVLVHKEITHNPFKKETREFHYEPSRLTAIAPQAIRFVQFIGKTDGEEWEINCGNNIFYTYQERLHDILGKVQ